MPEDSDYVDSSNDEIIIAQEQNAVSEPNHLGSLKKNEGTLILTNRRLIFACGDERLLSLARESEGGGRAREVEEGVTNAIRDFEGIGSSLYYSEIEDLDKISKAPENLFIPVSQITSVSGKRELLLEKPALKVNWRNDSGIDDSVEFKENLTGRGRKRNLNDWATVIEQLKAGRLKIQKLPAPPAIGTLEGKVAYMMRDMQEKGPAEIEQQVEERFKVESDLDEIEDSCQKLVSMGYLEKVPDAAETFYRKRSPIGLDGLSS